jgi:hypothetical protein
MSSPSHPPPEQCALGSDGQLLDANNINWYRDADDSEPIHLTKPRHAHVLGEIALPAEKVAGARRSGRIFHPSARACDPNNTKSAASNLPCCKRLCSRSLSPDQATQRKQVRLICFFNFFFL